jgi:hypothetical protein
LKDLAMRLCLLVAGLCVFALSACASPQTASAPGHSDCFRTADVNGYAIVDDTHVDVTVGPNRHYILTTFFNARDLDWSQTIALRSHTNWICTGSGPNWAEVIGGRPRRSYPITEIVRAPPPPAHGS